MRAGKCTCVALYDWSTEFTGPAFYEVAHSFFSANGITPDVGILAIGDAPSNRVLKHSTVAKRIQQPEYANASYVGLYRTVPNYAQLVFGWDVVAGFHTRTSRDMYFCCGVSVAQLGLDYMAGLIERIAGLTQLSYGIGYTLPFHAGPEIYALGMATGPDDSQQGKILADRTCAWFRERIGQNRHRQGYLRDVYPLNVVSQPHLEMPVHGMALGEWIRHAPQRGSLRPLAGGAWLWRIEDAQVASVQAELEAAGLLIAQLGSTRR